MKVNNIQNTSFKGALNNKFVLKALEKISDHSATFATLTAVSASMILRPLAIKLTPGVKKENKEHSIANSVSSGAIKLATSLAVSLPIEHAVKTIENNPREFLKNDFLHDKNSFNFASQMLKLSSSLLTAIPKTILTVSMIPLIMDKVFKQMPKTKENPKEISFKGGFEKIVSKYFNNNIIENFAKKHSSNSINIARNMAVASDILLAGSFALRTKKSKKIDPKRKNNLIYNSIISTGLSVLAGCGLDKIAKEGGRGFLEKFIQANKSNPKLAKYVQGINILRPTVIFALIYYGILPVVSNYTAQKLSDRKEN